MFRPDLSTVALLTRHEPSNLSKPNICSISCSPKFSADLHYKGLLACIKGKTMLPCKNHVTMQVSMVTVMLPRLVHTCTDCWKLCERVAWKQQHELTTAGQDPWGSCSHRHCLLWKYFLVFENVVNYHKYVIQKWKLLVIIW